MTRQKFLMMIGLVLALSVALVTSPSVAQVKPEICDNGSDDDGDKAVDCKDSDCREDPACAPDAKQVCHNIGGADELGANCDPVSGICTITDQETGRTFTVFDTEFFGIVVGTSSPGALAAHLKHGDGPMVLFITPPLHLASQGDNHKASNVDCIGTRVFEQPEEPGN